eukprot:TRINITY_DN7124_c0_g2_i2.p1 TRINITY_DN7124_c0_g2~~TRINITY_DN7124_c0_g2_i2.p1  ORF type:complete len:180 (-),score=34.05 TRINITY_DN7124_c0_g2_i2:221-760(-)
METTIGVCVVGGESTGKTTICQRLAETYRTQWVPEYAREYLEGRDLTAFPFVPEDFEKIAEGQFRKFHEAKSRQSGGPIFCDTDAIITYMWSQELIGQVPMKVIDLSHYNPFDIYLLTDPQVPYEEDPLRFLPTMQERLAFHEKLILELDKRGISYHLISGNVEQRIDRVKDLLLNFRQ